MQAEEDQKAKDAEALRLAQEKANKGTESGANSGNATAGANTSSQGDTKDVPQTPAQRKLAGGVVVTPLVQDASGYGSSVSGASGPATVTPLAGGTESTPDVAQTGLGVAWAVVRHRGEFKQLVGYQLLTRQGSAGPIA